MKVILVQYKPFFLFLIKFIGFYLAFTLLYLFYLKQFNTHLNEVDGVTKLVAQQANGLLLFFNQNSQIHPNEFEASVKMILNGKYVSRIIEGCNAISVIILFASFVFAFSVNWLRTFFYIFMGAILIYCLNIVRIALLNYAIFHFPKYEGFLHGTIFPLFIYGVVFLLWVLWVTRFSGYDKLGSKK